jgi:hypothetical protein
MTYSSITLTLSSLALIAGMATVQAQNLEPISIHSLANPEAAAQDRTEPSKLLNRTYQMSVVALGAATAADMASSLKFTADGQHEANGLLANSSGGYGSKGALIEAGFVGGSLLLQHFLIKGHPGLRLPFTISNFVISGFQAWNVHHNVSY